MISAEVVIKIQFYDLDPMRIVWHGNYPRFLEQARSVLFEKNSRGRSWTCASNTYVP
jgi:acyl-CoA thioester hydrolase